MSAGAATRWRRLAETVGCKRLLISVSYPVDNSNP
jgi:hypothetical protein